MFQVTGAECNTVPIVAEIRGHYVIGTADEGVLACIATPGSQDNTAPKAHMPKLEPGLLQPGNACRPCNAQNHLHDWKLALSLFLSALPAWVVTKV